MSSSEKRKISAREILADLRDGLDREALKQKHGLSDQSLEKVFSKLISAGLLPESENPAASAPPQSPPEEPGTAPKPLRQDQCPACSAALDAGAEECAGCGVILAKFSALQQERTAAASRAPEGRGKRWLMIGAATLAVCVVAGYLLFRSKPHEGRQGALTPGAAAPKASTAAGAKPKVSQRPAGQQRPRSAPNIFAMDRGDLVELKFVPESFPMGLGVTQGSGGIHFFETADPNQGFTRFPPETGHKRYYDQFSIAGRKFLMLTEASDPPRIYLDANNNGDMTDDPGPFEGERPQPLPNHYTIDLPYEWEDTPAPYRFWFFPSRMGGVGFYPASYWLGQIDVHGKPYKVATFDGNSDGDFSNDPLIIDADGDGKASDSEMLRPGQTIALDGAEITVVAIAPSGRWVRVERK